MPTRAVLLVDDDPSVLDFVGYSLRTKGYRVIPAADAREALEAAGSYTGRINLLLTDIAMPGMNGIELASQISAQRPETKILFITAYGSAFDTGPHPVLAKPFAVDQLVIKVREVLTPK